MDTSKSSVFPLEYILEFKGWGFREDVSICIIYNIKLIHHIWQEEYC